MEFFAFFFEPAIFVPLGFGVLLLLAAWLGWRFGEARRLKALANFD